MGSNAKTGKFFIRGSQEQKRCTFLVPKHKSAIWDRTPPHLHIKPSLYLYVCRRVQGSQIFKQNWFILIHSILIVMFLIWVSLALGVGQVGGGYSGGPPIVYVSLAVFWGKESSNRIEISWLVQDLLNFGVLGSLRLWVDGVVGGYPHTCAHACTCTRAHMHTYTHIKHDNFNCKWPMGGGVSTNHKSSNRIELSWLGQDLFNC